MSSSLKNLSNTDLKANPLFKDIHIGLVVADWNAEITHSMRDAAISFLKLQGLNENQITCEAVPGTFELPVAAQFMAMQKNVDAVIAIGCVIQGETRHFDFICDACANGITEVGLKFNKPVIFSVLTTQNLEQAKDRSGGKHGNKGIEGAETALKMLLLKQNLGLM